MPSKAQNLVKSYQGETSVSSALCFFQSCDNPARNIAFSQEWTKYPASLFEVDPRIQRGYYMRQGIKSDQYLGAKTFDEVTQMYVRQILNLKSLYCTGVHCVGDRYNLGEDKSIKGDERHRRETSESTIHRVLYTYQTLRVSRKPKKQSKPCRLFFSSSLGDNKHLIPDSVTFFLGGTVTVPGVTLLITNRFVSNLVELS